VGREWGRRIICLKGGREKGHGAGLKRAGKSRGEKCNKVLFSREGRVKGQKKKKKGQRSKKFPARREDKKKHQQKPLGGRRVSTCLKKALGAGRRKNGWAGGWGDVFSP